jgi:hypothetical protein
VRAFLESLAVIVIDSATSGKATASAEADFRDAAVHMISEAGGLGYTRRSRTIGAVFYPQLTLRDSWRPGHVTVDSSTTVTYASLDMLTIRLPAWYTTNLYVAVQLSLIDALGPFSEVAIRGHVFDDANHKSLVFALGAVVPRMEVMLGSPSLSRNITVGASVSARAYRGVATGSMTADYCILGMECAADQSRRGFTVGNLEAGVFLRYVL